MIATIVAACAIVLFSGCHNAGTGATAMVPVPIGLDSAGVARWLTQQRTDCRGHLITLLDEGGAVRNFDSVATGTSVRFYAGLVGVQCRP
jgi:hypothetical protein